MTVPPSANQRNTLRTPASLASAISTATWPRVMICDALANTPNTSAQGRRHRAEGRHRYKQYHEWYYFWVWMVVYLPGAVAERDTLDARERSALYNAVRKLQVLGPELGYPHSSAIQGADRLRELRPRAGRSPTRAL